MIKIILLLMLFFNSLYAFKYIQYSFLYNKYIEKLKKNCNTKISKKCCLNSINIIEKNKFYLNKDVKNCKKINQLKCLSSFKWCEDNNIYNKKEKEYNNKMLKLKKSLTELKK